VTRARDGAFAGALLLVAIGLTAVVSIEPSPAWVTLGVTLTLAAEWLAYRRPTVIRRGFERRSVLAAIALVGVVALLGAAMVVPVAGLSLSIGALGGYVFLLLAATAIGISEHRR